MQIKLAILSLTIMTASCAALISGSEQEISFDSNIKGTEILIDDKLVCRTPCIVKVERERSKLMVVARKSGYEDRTLFLESGINPVTLVNVVSLGFSTFGFSTDMSSGGFWQYSPNSYYVTMGAEPRTPRERQQRARENRTRNFVLKNYSQLLSEAYDVGGHNEYVQTLSAMSGLSVHEVRDILKDAESEGNAAELMVEACQSQNI